MATYLTPAGVEKLKTELERLSRQKRELSREVEKAREHGDLRENAEYHAAKERLAQVVGKINEIQMKLADVRIIDPSDLPADRAFVGSRLRVKDLSDGGESVYTLCPPDESSPSDGRISIQSPLGKAFLGKRVNDEVIARLPGGDRPFKILSIEPGF